MRTSVLFLLFALCIPRVLAFEKNGRGSRPMALANAFTAVADDPWAAWHNPAALASISSVKSSTCFVPEPFGMKELRTISAAVACPTSIVNFGVVIDDFGTGLYRESTAAVGIGSSVGDGVALGVTANIGFLSIERYGTATFMTFDIGARLELVERVSLGYAWKNVARAMVGGEGERLPQIQTLGVCYTPHSLVQVTVDLEKDIRFPFVVHAGIELNILDNLAFRFGCSNKPDTFATGVGAMVSGWEFAYALTTHPQLGMTHGVGVSFEFPR